MKKFIAAILSLILVVLFYQFYQLYSHHGELKSALTGLNNKLSFFKEENFKLQADLEYFQEPENLEKELRSRFNYKNPEEKLIIIVPPKNSEN